MIIHPEVIPTPDCPTVRFKQPKEQIDLDIELTRIMSSQGWPVGTYFHVQFIDHDRTRVLLAARFLVSEEVESLQTNEANPHQPVTRSVTKRTAEMIGGWWRKEAKRGPGRPAKDAA